MRLRGKEGDAAKFKKYAPCDSSFDDVLFLFLCMCCVMKCEFLVAGGLA